MKLNILKLIISKTHSLSNPNKGLAIAKVFRIWIQPIWLDTLVDPNRKNGKTRSLLLKWTGLSGGQSWVFWRFDTPKGIQRKLLLRRIFKKFKKDEHGHGMYFQWFKGSATCWVWEGVRKPKVSKMTVSKACFFVENRFS